MFGTQVYGTVLGGFVNYAVMTSIVKEHRELLIDSDGNSSWSGATIQSYNTNATSWALAKYLYRSGTKYELVPFGLLVGAGIVTAHRIFTYVSDSFPSVSLGTDLSLLVCPKNSQLRIDRNQLSSIHPVRRLYPLQPIANLCHFQSAHSRLFHPILPPQLPSAHF